VAQSEVSGSKWLCTLSSFDLAAIIAHLQKEENKKTMTKKRIVRLEREVGIEQVVAS